MKKTLILYHIIYIAFLTAAFGQDLTLKIVGADSTETKQIDSLNYKRIHPDFDSAKIEMDSVFSKLTKSGYLEARIKSIDKESDTSMVSAFDLGKKYEWLTVFFDHTQINTKDLSLFTKQLTDSSFTIPISSTDKVLRFLNKNVAENGLPFASLKLSGIKTDAEHQLYSTLKISNNGTKRRIDKILVKGYETFPKSYLKHFLKLREGSTFSIEAIQKKTGLLDNLRFASEIRPPEVLFRNDSTILYLYLERRKSNSFDGFLGFGSNEETNKLELDGYLNLELVNNLNYGESLNLYYKSDENKQRSFNLKATLPYLFKSPLGVDAELRIFKKDTLFTTVNQVANLFYQFNSKNRLSLGIENIQSNNLTSVASLASIEDYKTNLYSLGYNFVEINKSNRFLFPFKSSIMANIAWGNRTIDHDKLQQTKFYLDSYRIFDLNDKNSVYLRLNAAGLFSETYFENELFRFGGINSIRGFEENSLTATSYGVINTEYRYLLAPSMYVHSIIDLSYLESNMSSQREKLYSFGFGFGILTRAGLFKLIYSNGKNETQNFKLSNSKVHLSLSAFF